MRRHKTRRRAAVGMGPGRLYAASHVAASVDKKKKRGEIPPRFSLRKTTRPFSSGRPCGDRPQLCVRLCGPRLCALPFCVRCRCFFCVRRSSCVRPSFCVRRSFCVRLQLCVRPSCVRRPFYVLRFSCVRRPLYDRPRLYVRLFCGPLLYASLSSVRPRLSCVPQPCVRLCGVHGAMELLRPSFRRFASCRNPFFLPSSPGTNSSWWTANYSLCAHHK
jgi:hypothetical protein